MTVNEERTLPTAQVPAQSSAEDEVSPLTESLVWNEEMELCLANPELIWGRDDVEEPDKLPAEARGIKVEAFIPQAQAAPPATGETTAPRAQAPTPGPQPAPTKSFFKEGPESRSSEFPAPAKPEETVVFTPVTGPLKGGPELAELLATRAELKRLEERHQQLEKLRWELNNSLLRQQNDFNNYRRRIEQEREALRQHLLAELLLHFLPVIDNLLRALETSSQAPAPQAAMQLFQGLELVTKQFEDVMSGFGLYHIPALGERFDPGVHEAVALDPTNDVVPDTITHELLRGYQLGNKLLRAAIVKVAVQP